MAAFLDLAATEAGLNMRAAEGRAGCIGAAALASTGCVIAWCVVLGVHDDDAAVAARGKGATFVATLVVNSDGVAPKSVPNPVFCAVLLLLLPAVADPATRDADGAV